MLQIRENPPLSLAEQRAELGMSGAPVPPAWEETILACLAKEPERRPQSAGEIARRLGIGPDVASGPAPSSGAAGRRAVLQPAPGDSAAGERGLKDRATKERRSGARKWMLPAAATAIILGATGYLFWSRRGLAPAGDRGLTFAADSAAAKPAPSAGLEKLPRPEAGKAWTVPDLNLQMAYIWPGTFTMGSPASDEDRYDDEGPQTRVKLTRGFWLGKIEVTQGQWEPLMGSNSSTFKGADRPVEQVSWTEAMEFCRKLTERERSAGRLPDGHVYTLPTEAQWEYACRAGTTRPYAGDGNLDEMAWYSQNSGKTTHPVAQKRPNAWGLYDMHGNVREWCLNWYGNYAGGSVTDPAGPTSGSLRVNRGGAWNNGARYCRSSDRGGLAPGSRFFYLGFRLALAPSPP